MNQILTKSKYILGLECPRHLWITFNQPEKIRKVTLAEEFKFSEGDKVGQLAKTLFSGGIDLSVENYSENIQKTKEAMKNKGKEYQIKTFLLAARLEVMLFSQREICQ